MRIFCGAITLTLASVFGVNSTAGDEPKASLSLVVMDPLAAPLSCPCVEGYAQRKYEVLAEHLQTFLGRNVKLTYGESLNRSLKKSGGRADMVIGKQSVVLADAAAEIELTPISRLTDQQGSTEQYGMIVVNRDDPAKSIDDLAGYTIIFGPEEAEEKHFAAMQLFRGAGIAIPKNKRQIDLACSDGACKVIDLGPQSKTAAVISSYAQPLLEGCGTIKKGDLRVVGKTVPVPFVTVFVAETLAEDQRAKVQAALAAVALQPDVLEALESLVGFLPIDSSISVTKEKLASQSSQWPGWRGAKRDGHVDWLPATLAALPDVLWEVPLAHAGLGGIAATDRYVVFGDRDLDDLHDVFHCLDAGTGETLWEVERLAIAALDYGNTPRATPLIEGEHVYCLGAHGHLLCIRLADGYVSWEKNFRDDFPLQDDLPWGYCGSPLLVDGKLIVAPGAAEASLIAIDPVSGEIRWKTPGVPPSYGSLTVGILGGVKQIVGHDADTLGGWDIATGERLWTVKPDAPGDFNVPTPILDDGRLIIATENNGTRRFNFDKTGRIIADPIASNAKLCPDMSTPVVMGNRLFCAKDFLYCLDLDDDLAESWRIRDRAIGDYAAIIASEDRLLVIGKGELLLLRTDGQRQIIARQKVFDEQVNVYSHPAPVGNRLFIRGESKLRCIQL